MTVNRRLAGDMVSSVTHDEVAGIGAVLKHLTDLGHREFAFLPTHLVLHWQIAIGRIPPMGTQIGNSDAPQSVIEPTAFHEDEGRRRTDQPRVGSSLHRSCAPATSCGWSSEALRKWGLGCPSDVSVRLQRYPFVDRITPALTTIHGDHFQLGWTAAEILLRA